MGGERRFNQAKFFQGWLELVRLPNLFTIPGDVLAGASLALISCNELSLMLPVLIISLSLYISGLLLNDYVDHQARKNKIPNAVYRTKLLNGGSDGSKKDKG